MTDSVPETELPSRKIAIVLDNVVQDILHTDERLAALFLSQPKIVDITDWVAANPDTPLPSLNGKNFDSLGIVQA